MTIEKKLEKLPPSLTLSTTLVIGTPSMFRERELSSNVKFLVGLVKTNAPCFEFVRFHDLRVANISILCDEENNEVDEWKDAFAHNEGTEIPELDMHARLMMIGTYTGLIPDGMKVGDKFVFKTTLTVRPPPVVDPKADTDPAPAPKPENTSIHVVETKQ
jgi:hypothetical protein